MRVSVSRRHSACVENAVRPRAAFDDGKDTVQARLRSDRKFRKELLREGVECLVAGDVDTGKAILRDYINTTIGFEERSRRTKRPAKSLMPMLGPSGNPQARNLFEVIHHLQKAEGLHFE